LEAAGSRLAEIGKVMRADRKRRDRMINATGARMD